MGRLRKLIGKDDGELRAAVGRMIERGEIAVVALFDALARSSVVLRGGARGYRQFVVTGIMTILNDRQGANNAAIGRSKGDGARTCRHVIVGRGEHSRVAIGHPLERQPCIGSRGLVVAISSHRHGREIVVVDVQLLLAQ